jgi:ATP-dependent Lhr-like helicase
MPFWKDEIKGRRLETAFLYGEIFRRLEEANRNGTLFGRVGKMGLDDNAALKAQTYVKHQIAVTGALPDDRTIIIGTTAMKRE